MTERAIAVDLGGTNLRCSVIDDEGRMQFEVERPTAADEGVEAVIGRIVEIIDRAVEAQALDETVRVGLAAPGPLDSKRGIVRYAPNLPGWDEIPLRDELERQTGRSVKIANDANVQALGEFYFGAARDVRDLVYVALGTGFGGGVISNGALVDGTAGLGGELGHTTINMLGPRCSCGSPGCVEAYCSGWAIARDGQLLADSGRSAMLAEIGREREISARDVSKAANSGDDDAAEVIKLAGRALGVGLANFVNIFNPSMVVIGGGLAEIGEPLLSPARAALRRRALGDLYEYVYVRRSALGQQTGLYGAAALVLYEYK